MVDGDGGGAIVWAVDVDSVDAGYCRGIGEGFAIFGVLLINLLNSILSSVPFLFILLFYILFQAIDVCLRWIITVYGLSIVSELVTINSFSFSWYCLSNHTFTNYHILLVGLDFEN